MFPLILMTFYEYFRSVVKAWQPTVNDVFGKPIHLPMPIFIRAKFESIQLHRQKLAPTALPETDLIQLAIHSHTAVINKVVEFFQQRIGNFCQFHQLQSPNVSICLREALANAIIHGNLEVPSAIKEASWEKFEALIQEREALPKFAARQVTIRCQLTLTELRVDIADQGQGFDPANSRIAHLKKIASATHDLMPVLSKSGRGLFIIISFMDAVYWNDAGNCITMIKFLQRA